MKKLSIGLIVFLLVLNNVIFSSGQQEAEGTVALKWPCIWVGKDSKAAAVASLVEEFNAAHPKVVVEIEDQPDYDGYEQKIRTSIAAKVVPDIFTLKYNPTTLTYYESDRILDFKEIMDSQWKGQFKEGTLSQATYKGMLKSLPYEVAITPVWYNKALFDQAGAKIPETWDELMTASEKLKAAGIVPTSQMTGGANAWTSMLWYSHIVASLGGQDAWTRPFSDPIYVEAAKKLLSLYSDGNTTLDAIGGDAGVSGGHFLAGETAMFINGPWYIGRVKEDAPDVYNHTIVGPAPSVGSRQGAQIGFLQTNLAAADYRAENPAKNEAILSFLKWMTAPENVARISKDAGSLFAVKYDSSSIDDPLQKQFIDASNNASFTNVHLEGAFKTEVVREFGQALGMMALEEITPEEFVQRLQNAEK